MITIWIIVLVSICYLEKVFLIISYSLGFTINKECKLIKDSRIVKPIMMRWNQIPVFKSLLFSMSRIDPSVYWSVIYQGPFLMILHYCMCKSLSVQIIFRKESTICLVMITRLYCLYPLWVINQQGIPWWRLLWKSVCLVRFHFISCVI